MGQLEIFAARVDFGSKMPRMRKAELLEIIDKGLSQCQGLGIDPFVRERIADYSQCLPSFTHLLIREAALSTYPIRF